MSTCPSHDAAFVRINAELAHNAGHNGIAVEGAGAAIAVTDLCRTWRAVRPELDHVMDWLEHNAAPALELFRLMARIADNVCKVSGSERRT